MNTARWLRLLTTLIVGTLVAAAGLAALTLGTAYDGLDATTARERAAASSDVHRLLNTMSASAQDALLAGNGKGLAATGAAGAQDPGGAARKKYVETQTEFHRLILRLAADRDTFTATEVERLLAGVGAYDRRITELLGVDSVGDAESSSSDKADRADPGPLDGEDLVRFRSAQKAFDQVRFEARQLGVDGDSRAQWATWNIVSRLELRIEFVAGLGLAAVALLVVLQVFVARRFRRIVNPALVVVTLAIVAVGVVYLGDLAPARTYLRESGPDELGRVAAAYRVRADSHALPAEESEFLLDTATAEWPYLEASTTVFDLSADRLETYQEQLKAESAPTVGSGPLQDPRVFQRYVAFQSVDARLRSVDGAKRPMEALNLHFGAARTAFEAYDRSLKDVADRRSSQVYRHIGDVRADLGEWRWIIPGAAGLAVALILIGVRPRLKEYG